MGLFHNFKKAEVRSLENLSATSQALVVEKPVVAYHSSR